VNEVVAMIEDDNSVMSADVFITPPSDDEMSAEDSDDDDHPSSINHLSSAQLSAEADAKILTTCRRSKRLNPPSCDSSDDDSAKVQHATSSSSREKKRKLSKKSTKEPPMKKWGIGDLSKDVGCVAAVQEQPLFLLHDLTPADFFELFFDEDVMNMMVENTMQYAREQKGDHSFEVTTESMKLFIAVLC
jgi:Transposase IS4